MSYDAEIALPLQQDPTFTLDTEEYLLACIGAYDLILLEEATEIFRRTIFDNDLIEQILQRISYGKNVEFLPRKIFPFWVPPNYQKNYETETVFNKQIEQKYDREVKKYKKLFEKAKSPNIVGIFGFETVPISGNPNESFEHFAAFYFHDGQLEVFDAMQCVEDQCHFFSHYTTFFGFLGTQIFDVPKNKVRVLQCPRAPKGFSLQLTGGTANLPNYVKEALERGQIDEGYAHRLRLQSTESQNHFCYLWAVWYLHLRLLNMNFTDVVTYIAKNNIDPLFIIKKYAYCLFHSTRMVENVPEEYRDFFNHNFPVVWTNDQQLGQRFRRLRIFCDCRQLRVDDCFRESFNLETWEQDNSIVPFELFDRCRQY